MIVNSVLAEIIDRYPDDMQVHQLVDDYIKQCRQLYIAKASHDLLKGALDDK